jgi:L-seryl-tRNA(Ser) seleniumtransferase
MPTDPRRTVPSTDLVLADVRLREPQDRLGRGIVRSAVRDAQARVRAGNLDPRLIVNCVLDRLPKYASTLHPVLNATGVVLHTNLGRAALSVAAKDALLAAAGYVDVEFDLATGSRAPRGRGALDALRNALPDAGDVLIVNNGAAALLLAITALAQGREVVWSRGEMIEIGDGFRLPDLVACAGAIVHEVGTTNRTVRDDYVAALGERTGCMLKVHLSNFQMTGFSASVSVSTLSGLGVPLVVDVGSGLLSSDRTLPDEPDIASSLRAGADIVTASCDKLLGGPQGGVIAGRSDLIALLRRHPMARALRVDKLTLAALEATLRGPETPTSVAMRLDPRALKERAEVLAAQLGDSAVVCETQGAAGGGSAPGASLHGWAVSLPEYFAVPLRTGVPAVIARLDGGRCLLDLRSIPPEEDVVLLKAILACT